MNFTQQLRLSDLWRYQGAIDRGPYLFWGVLLFAIKYNLDRLMATLCFHRSWSIFAYLTPSSVHQITDLSQDQLPFYSALLALALPFIFTGIALTLRRLRAAQLPLSLVAVFFIPLINLLFFLILSVLPTSPSQEAAVQASSSRYFFARLIPKSSLGSAVMALALVLPTALLATVFSVHQLQNYGWGLFMGLPFSVGLASSLIAGYHTPQSFSRCLSVAMIAMMLLGLALLAVAIEGALCIAMAFPIGAVLAGFGALFGYAIQHRSAGAIETPKVLAVLLFFVPLLMGAEAAQHQEPSLIPVVTSIEIDAPPQVVWHHVVSFSELAPPRDWIFKIGIAYPLRAEIFGHGVGAERHCVFSTGPFVEPIEVWDEPHLLKFSVRSQPPSMKEFSPYVQIDAPHISNFLVSKQGQFLLTSLPGGKTRLEGTTWYYHRIWPADYWRVWSDWILHQIHLRVLNHIKTLSEQNV